MYLVLLAALFACSPASVADPAATPSNLIDSVRAYEAAANRHDWQRVLPLIADNPVIELGGDLALVGRDSARALHEWERAMGTEIHFTDCTAEDQTVRCQATEANDFLRLAGLGPIKYSASTMIFERGRVVRMTALLSDDSNDAVAAYMGAFLAWAGKAEPKAVATFLKPDGSFDFGFEQAMTFKRLLGVYVRARAGGSRLL